ncbi:ATP synthase F1 subunit gamma [Candidatus Omnitrophota bacterium]
MATLRAVKTRIVSVQKIKKITSALEVVALTRLRRMELETIASRNYFDSIREMLFDTASNINYKAHPFLARRDEIRSIGLICIFSDKGLCGNFNANMGYRFSKFVAENETKNIKVIRLGKKGARYIKEAKNVNILNNYSSSDKDVVENGSKEIAQSLIDMYLGHEIDAIYMLYSKFRLHLLGEANVIKLLPFVLDEADASQRKSHHRDYIYEPDVYDLFDNLVKEYIVNNIHQGMLESRSAEEMSRMLAMKSATDSANDMLDKLNLSYNKTRQGQITKELAEVISANA